MKRKFIGRWVTLDINGKVIYGKIVRIILNSGLKKPVFHLVSRLGNDFYLTREELETYEVVG